MDSDYGGIVVIGRCRRAVAGDVANRRDVAADVNGMTPLDYTTFRVRNMSDDLPFCNESSPRELEQMLVYLGCDPKHENKYGISWADVHSQMPNMDRASKEWGNKPSPELAVLRRKVV